MSQEVDQRVVEMRFDNAKFEKNVQQSIDSLNKLNRSLKFEGAEKGFETIENASAKVDFDKMQGALETLSGKFSALEVIGTTALVRITSKAIDTGEKLVKSLSIDQVTSGWNKYAQKTASVQTIMNATGKSITKVNQYLEKLMWFSDETSYGFTDMTSALSTLTAAGGDIEKMIPMIMGMANATAYAGKGAAEFQRVVYNLAQSYGTGAIQLIDWKSVEQAGAGSQQLKQLIIDTAVELGKLKKGEVTTGTFDSTLQKKWADREVMEQAFGKYAEFAEAVQAEMKAHPEKYNYQAANAIEALADQYDEVTVKAFKAAQEAKSFSEAVDATKDAVSSGWMQTFDILFGNYEEAKSFWLGLAEEFWNIFAGGMGSRNSWLKKAFNGGLDQLLDDTALSDAGDSFGTMLEKDLIRSGRLTQDAVDEAGSFQKALQSAGVTADDLYEEVQRNLAVYKSYTSMSDKELAGYSVSREALEKTIDAYQRMADAIQNGEVNLDGYAAKMGQMSGREHFFNGILNILEGINSVLTPIRNGFDEVFHTDGGPLYSMLAGFDDLTSKLVLKEDTLENLTTVFRGFFSVVSVGFKGIRVAGRIAIALVGKLLDALSPLGNVLLDVGAAFGGIFTQLNEGLSSAQSAEDILDALATAFGALLQPVKDVYNTIRTLVHGGSLADAKNQLGSFRGIVQAVGQVFENFGLKGISVSGLLGSAVQVLGGIFYLAFDTIVRLPVKAGAAMQDFAGAVQTAFYNVAGACKDGLAAIKEFFALDGVDIYRLLALIDVGALALAIWGVSKAMNTVAGATKKLLANPVTDLLNSMKNAVDTWTKQQTTNNFVNVAKGISIAIGVISASVYMLSKIDDPKKALQALGSVMASLFGMVAALKVVAATDITGLDTAKLFGTIAAISLGMTVLAAAFTKIGSMHSYQVNNGMEAISRIASALMGMIGVLTIMNTYGDGTKGSGAFVAAAAGICAIALALIPLAKAEEKGFNIDGAVEAINGVAIAISILMVASGFAQKLAGPADTGSVDKIIKYLTKLGGMLIAINAMGTALLMAAGAVAIFASLGDNLWKGLAGAAVMLGEVGVALGVLAGIKLNPTRMKKAAEAMAVASAALLIVAAAVKQMGNAMASDTGGAGMAGVTVMLIELAAALYLLGKNAPESTVAAVAMLAMGVAMIEMAAAIKMLAEVDLFAIGKGIVTMVASFAALAAGIGFLSASAAGIVSLAGSCLMLATALLILTPAFKGLATLTAGEALAGVIGTIGMMIGLFAVGTIAPVAQGMIVFSACLVSMGKAFSAFAGGLVKLSIAAGILAVLSLSADPVCQAIIEAGPYIERALITIVTAICNTVVACAEPLGLALEALLKMLLQVTVDMIGWLWSGNGGDGEDIQGALEGLWNSITSWFGEHNFIQTFKDWLSGKDIDIWTLLFGNAKGKNIPDNPYKRTVDSLTEKSGFDGMGGGKTDGRGSGRVQTDAMKQAADASGVAAVNMEKTATMMQTTSKTAGEVADGMVRISTDTGEVYTMTAEQAKALMTGKAAADEMAGATCDLGTAADTTNGALAKTATAMVLNAGTAAGSSAVVDEAGNQLDGKEQQLADDTDETIQNGIAAAEDTAETGGKNLAQRLLDGFLGLLGLNKDKITAGAEKVVTEVSGLISPGDMLDSAGQSKTNAPTTKSDTGNTKGWREKIAETAQAAKDDYLAAIADLTDSTTDTGTGGNTTKSSGSKKTVGEQIQAKYKMLLAANKTLKDTADEEYALWQAENQYSASADELMAKKTENAAKDIVIQTDRVALAQKQYNELTSKWGADKDETKEAYLTLLQEKTSLADLKAKQYTDLFKEVAERYDTNLDTLEKQYKLWSADNDKTATKRDKILKERAVQTEELAIREKKEAAAEEQYNKLNELYGESDLRTIEAYNDWLDAKTESQELRNEIAQQELALIEAEIDAISTAQNISASRMDILQKVYGDGDLSARADAYKQAVETYGKDSAEARKAQFQGTTSSILAAVSAMQNLNAQMQQTEQYQDILNKGYVLGANGEHVKLSQDEIDDYTQKMLSSKTAFLGFAENLADAFGMDDTGKQVTLKLANAIQKNWKPLKEGFMNAWDKAFANNPELKDKFAKAFGEAFSETGMEIGSEFISTLVALMQGDWANALASGLSFMLDFACSDAGQALIQNGLPMLEQAFGQIAKTAQVAMGSQGMTGEVADAVSKTGELVGGSGGLLSMLGGVGEAFAGLGTTIMGFIAEFWPYILAAVAIVGVIAGIAALFNRHSGSAETTDAEEAGIDYPTEYEKGIREGAPKVADAVKDMTDAANDVALAAAQSIANVLDCDVDYEPTITPVVDLTNVVDSAEDINSAFASEKAMTLDSTVSRRIAGEMDASPSIQNGVRSQSDANLLNAIASLGDRMDGVGQSIRGMKVVMDGRKTVGYIDSKMAILAGRS